MSDDILTPGLPASRVLLISQVFPPMTGGSGRWLWELYRRLTVVTADVLAGHARAEAAFDRQAGLSITRADLEFPSWGLLHPGSAWRYARRLHDVWQQVSRHGSTAVHCGKSLPEGLLALMLKTLRGVPYVVYAHGEELTLAQTSRELAMLTRRVLRGAAIVVANSAHTRQLLIDEWQIAHERIAAINPGVDTARFVPASPDPELRRRLGWDGRRVVLTAGTLQQRKGQDMMIRALSRIRVHCPDVLYSLIGRGVDQPYLERLAGECAVADLVQFRGSADDTELVQCYQQCDLFALPNRRIGWDLEGFGMVLVEAQSCGRPVIAGNSGGAPETLRDGVTGRVIDATDPDALAAAVIELLDAPAQRAAMGTAARQWVEERFDWTPLARRADRVFAAMDARAGAVS